MISVQGVQKNKPPMSRTGPEVRTSHTSQILYFLKNIVNLCFFVFCSAKTNLLVQIINALEP